MTLKRLFHVQRIALMAAACLLMVACGGESNTTDNGNKQDSSATTANSNTNTTVPTPDPNEPDDDNVGKTDNRPDSVRMDNSQSAPVEGIDVSHDQGEVDWKTVTQSGITFAYAKATEGNTFVDPMFKRNWSAMGEAGIRRGAYHFYRVGDDAADQAKNFTKQFTIGGGDLIPMLDVEEGSIPEGVRLDKNAMQADIIAWLEQVAEDLNCTPIIYTSPSFADSYLDDPAFGEYKLWIAEYGVEEPKVPTAWGNNSWTIWQYEDNATVPGVNGNVDKDRYHGSRAEFDLELVCLGVR